MTMIAFDSPPVNTTAVSVNCTEACVFFGSVAVKETNDDVSGKWVVVRLGLGLICLVVNGTLFATVDLFVPGVDSIGVVCNADVDVVVVSFVVVVVAVVFVVVVVVFFIL